MAEQTRGPEDAEDGTRSRPDAQGVPRKRREKRKRSPAPVAPEDEYVLTPWSSLVTESTWATTDQRLHHEIIAYVAYVQPKPQELAARHQLVGLLQKVLRRRFPDGELKLYGSTATGLCLPNGDMDLAMISRQEFLPHEKTRALFQMSSILKAARLTQNVTVKARARVPILSFTSLPEHGSLSVDIGINNTDGPRALELVNGYLATMPALRPLVLVLKAFLSQRDLNNPAFGGLGSYCILCMCISFLQLNPSNRPQDYIDKPMETESLGALLADFLCYYGTQFPYATSYICVAEGKLLPKESAEWIKNKANGLAIQCLVNPENDIGKAAGRLDAIRTAFKEGHAAILALSLEDASVLSPLVAMKQSTLDHRAHIQRIIDEQAAAQTARPPPRRPIPDRPPNKYQRKAQPQPQPRRASPPPRQDIPLPPRPPQAQSPDYGLAFGAGSAMGWGPWAGGVGVDVGGGGAVNRRGSGFASAGSALGMGMPNGAVFPCFVPAPYAYGAYYEPAESPQAQRKNFKAEARRRKAG